MVRTEQNNIECGLKECST